jgi:glycosyltransferase involved in cell wall biosynthesis
MNEIHVLHVLNSAHGGSALSTFELIEHLSHREVRSSLVCYNNATKEQSERIRDLVQGRVVFIPLYWMNKRIRSKWWKRPLIEAVSLSRTFGGYRYQREISELVRKGAVNLIHTSTILNPEGALASRRNNLPHLWHVRELVGPDKHFQFYAYRRWASFVSAHCEYLVANSSVTTRCLLRYFPEEKIKTIPNGIQVTNFSLRLHANSNARKVVAMVGSITSRWKNHELFVRTAALLQHREDIEFRIYGSLPNENDAYLRYLKRLVSHSQLESRIKFVSFKSPVDISSEIDVMFHPTQFESFGRIFVEAMAAGIPVVAINEGGAMEMIEDGVNGYLIPPGDAYTAAARIQELADSPQLRNQMGAKGRNVALSRYSMNRLCDDMIALYNETIRSSRR